MAYAKGYYTGVQCVSVHPHMGRKVWHRDADVNRDNFPIYPTVTITGMEANMLYFNREVSSLLGLTYFETGLATVSKRAYVKAARGSLDEDHMARLKCLGAKFTITRTQSDPPGWWRVAGK